MHDLNFLAAWLAILAGLVTGTVIGLFFHDPDWMGGYGSWRRRMMRLGHISFFGTGFLNLAFVVVGGAPASLGAAAGRLGGFPARRHGHAHWSVSSRRGATSFRRLFFIPVASLIVAACDFLVQGLWR